MVYIVTADNRALFTAAIAQMHRDRRQVFVEQLSWPLVCSGELEMDQYDGPATTYLVCLSEGDGAVLASARLLPTVSPHLMSDVFPQLCETGVPRGNDIWEGSRLCISPRVCGRRARLDLLWRMLCAVTETSLLFGVSQLTLTANRAFLPLVLNCGWETRVLGPTAPDGNDSVTAILAQINVQGLQRLRQRFGIPGPVTRFIAPPLPRAA